MNKLKEQLNPYSVLYAEDDQGVQEDVVNYLKRYFNEVYIANDGKEALSLYKSMQPDILFLDIDMPYIDGLEVVKIIREYNDNIPIIMLTAYTDTEKLLRATELNLSKYLIKPVDPLEFKDALHKLSKYFQKKALSHIQLAEHYIYHQDTQELIHYNQTISLTQKEKVLLSLLIEKANQCVTFIDIQSRVWDDDFNIEVSIQSVKLQVTLLRKKLPENSIQNVYGKGYILYIPHNF